MKTCSKCKIEKELTEFSCGPGRDGKSAWCKACYKAYKQTDKYKEQQKKYGSKFSKTPNRIEYMKAHNRNNGLHRWYGISLKEYKKMFAVQNECCAICKRHQSQFKKTLSVDHCHKTGKIRGLLCGECNLAIGLFKDDPERVLQAASYVAVGGA